MEVNSVDERIKQILLEAAADWNITLEELCGRSRRKNIVEARRYAARELRNRGLHLKEIGRWLGWRDHSTIVHMLEPTENAAAGGESPIPRR